MTYTIQALAGVAVALSAVAGVAFRRSRRALMRALGIDENAGKEVEGNVSRIVDGEPAAPVPAVQAAPEQAKKKKTKDGTNAYAPSIVSRLLSALVAGPFVVFTLLIVAPSELVAGSEGSLVFGFVQVWPVVVKAALPWIVPFVVVLVLLRKRGFAVGVAIVFAFGLCCYLQAMFMNGRLPEADGRTVIWTSYQSEAIWTLLVWLAVLVGLPIVAFKFPRPVHVGSVALAVALCVVQAVGIGSLFASDQAQRDGLDETYSLTQEGMYTVSNRNNVIVFVLDTYDTQDLLNVMPTHPHMFDEFTGFTWFKNSTGSLIPTRYGAPFLQTGQYPRYDERYVDYIGQRWGRSSFLSDLVKLNYQVGIYTDSLALEHTHEADRRAWVYDYTMNIHPERGPRMDEQGVADVLRKCAFYRDMPWALKPFFWFYTDEINNAMARQGSLEELEKIPYTMDDARWYDQLVELGLSIDDRGSYTGAYRFIHLLGTHYPFNISEQTRNVGSGNSTREAQAVGTMRIVEEYIRQLKTLGVYDKSTIVITADHGDWYLTPDPLTQPSSPIMIAKPAHASDEPLKESMAPIAAYDVLPTVIEAAGGDTSSYGRTMFDYEVGEARSRKYLMTTSDGTHNLDILEYEITGDAMDMKNWHLTGHSWPDDE